MFRRRFLHGAVLAGAAGLAGCAMGQSNPDIFETGKDGASAVDNDALGTRLDSYETGELTETEIADIHFMREEEKLARDTYIAMFDAWGLRVHENIVESEQSHMDAMLQLIEKYGLEDPATGVVGTFANETLQEKYTELVDWGQESELDSLKVGCRIEEIDMRDIRVRIDRTDESAILLVYENLLKGSRNHLRAFYRTLTKQDGEYEPVIISQERFDEIVNSDWETGKE
jgi:hypothetical protein